MGVVSDLAYLWTILRYRLTIICDLTVLTIRRRLLKVTSYLTYPWTIRRRLQKVSSDFAYLWTTLRRLPTITSDLTYFWKILRHPLKIISYAHPACL